MQETKNQITDKFIQDKLSELINYNLPIVSLNNIDNFMDNELNEINNIFIEELKKAKSELYKKVGSYIDKTQYTINELDAKNRDYEEYIKTTGQTDNFKKLYKNSNLKKTLF